MDDDESVGPPMADGGGAPSTDDDAPSTDDDRIGPPIDDTEVDRKRLVRILVVIGIGVPILIEVVSVAGIVSHSLGDGGATPTATEAVDGAGVGDELLAQTAPTETVADAYVTAYEDRWQFVLTVSVANVTGDPYRLSFDSVTTGSGTSVETTATTGWIDAGEEGTGTATWSLPPGERPESLTVAVSRDREEPDGTTHDVALGPVSVRQ